MTEAAQPDWRMPPEWQPHSGTWVAWPHNRETWPHNLNEAREEFRQLIDAIAEDEHVYVCLNDDEMSDQFGNWLAKPANLIFVHVPTNDAWARDFAPTFVVTDNQPHRQPRSSPPWFPQANHRLAGVNWRYNAWGGKYPPFDLDQQAAKRIAIESGVDCIDSKLCLEGGAIEVNDAGLLLTTRSCVLNPNRNPGWTIEQIDAEFKLRLGVDKIIWLPGDAILGDDTDGHIDQLVRFVDDATILYAWPENSNDPQLGPLSAILDELKQELLRLGMNYNLVPLLLPSDPVRFCGRRIPASYCNFVITNGSVIVPQFGDKNDDRALGTVADQFPGRKIVGLRSNNLSVGLGSFHCLTQQMPDVG